jgi:2-polyprenyl-3-methyl-5-hydroxy-6-metoxy-1,4-benzoquinol methylase
MLNNQPTYDPSIFDQINIDNAREVTLTSESGISTQTRWDSETPWLLNLVRQHIKQSGLIVDFGCGVGRLASPLVEQGFPVIGIDSSDLMRQHATKLIANDRFVAMTSSMFDQLINIYKLNTLLDDKKYAILSLKSILKQLYISVLL